MVQPKYNLPINAMFFSEALVGSHRSWNNSKENSQKSDSKNSCQEKRGETTYIFNDEEAYIVSTSKVDGAYGLPRGIVNLTNELQKVLRGVVKQSIIN